MSMFTRCSLSWLSFKDSPALQQLLQCRAVPHHRWNVNGWKEVAPAWDKLFLTMLMKYLEAAPSCFWVILAATHNYGSTTICQSLFTFSHLWCGEKCSSIFLTVQWYWVIPYVSLVMTLIKCSSMTYCFSCEMVKFQYVWEQMMKQTPTHVSP